jgi:hypothetical protein
MSSSGVAAKVKKETLCLKKTKGFLSTNLSCDSD